MVVAVLDVNLVAVMTAGTDLSSAAFSFAALPAGNGCVAVSALAARASISRLWVAIAPSAE